jgi:acyl-CoA thioester hydrolase|tara:strand:- start:3027 stop:3428 length:402 start_codon:yes stop_codon:yes gene_type:complete
MKINKTEHRIYYSDTDHGGVVYYANYLKWFEIGRTEILRQYGFNYADFENQNIMAPVVEVKCNYKLAAKYDDVIIIKTDIDKLGNSSIRFHYKVIRKKDNKLLAEGYTVNVFVDKKTMKSIKIPDNLRKSLQD